MHSIPMGRRLFALIFCVLAVTVPRIAAAATITLAWDPSATPNVTGYVVYVGTQSGFLTQSFDVGNQTTYPYPSGVDGIQYFFAVTSYVSGPDGTSESSRSAEVSGFSNAPPLLVRPNNQTSTVGQ